MVRIKTNLSPPKKKYLAVFYFISHVIIMPFITKGE